MSEAFELTVSRTIAAPRKELFEAWLAPEALSEFIRPMPEMSVPTVEVDAREGGAFRIVMQVGEEQMSHRGEYKTIDRYDELAFTWISPATIPGSLVTIRFRELGGNETEVVLHHKGFPDEVMCNNHEQGWTGILDTLASRAGERASRSAP